MFSLNPVGWPFESTGINVADRRRGSRLMDSTDFNERNSTTKPHTSFRNVISVICIERDQRRWVTRHSLLRALD